MQQPSQGYGAPQQPGYGPAGYGPGGPPHGMPPQKPGMSRAMMVLIGVGCLFGGCTCLGILGAATGKDKSAPPAPSASATATTATTASAAPSAAPTAPPKAAEPSLALEQAANEIPKDAPRATYPSVVAKFHAMNELKQEQFAKTFPGTVLSGSGVVFEVEKCGLLDDSKRYRSSCVKVILDDADGDSPRVALYFPKSMADKASNYNKGDKVTFKDCVSNSIKNWGMWSTATCDMPDEGK